MNHLYSLENTIKDPNSLHCFMCSHVLRVSAVKDKIKICEYAVAASRIISWCNKPSKMNNTHYGLRLSVQLLHDISASFRSVSLPGNIAVRKSSLQGTEWDYWEHPVRDNIIKV